MDALDTKLLQAAKSLLASGGAEALTMSALARRVGVSRATLYRRYGSKEALIRALEEDGAEVELPPSARERVLEAMRQLVGVEGRLHCTVEEVAAAASVSVMSIYRAFGDRAGLFTAFVDENTPRARTRRVLAQQRPLEEVLLVVAESALEFTSRNPGLLMASMTAGTQGDPTIERIRSSGQSTRSQLARYFRRLSAAGQLRDEEPQRLVAYWIGLVLAEGALLPKLFKKPPQATIEQRARRIVTAFLKLYDARRGEGEKAQRPL